LHWSESGYSFTSSPFLALQFVYDLDFGNGLEEKEQMPYRVNKLLVCKARFMPFNGFSLRQQLGGFGTDSLGMNT